MRVCLFFSALLFLFSGVSSAEVDDPFVDHLKPFYFSLRVGMNPQEVAGEVRKMMDISRVTVSSPYPGLLVIIWKGEDVFGDGRPEVSISIYSFKHSVACIVYTHRIVTKIRERYSKGGEGCKPPLLY